MYSDCSDGELRLAGKVTATSGRLEVCYNRAWGTVCSYAWGTTESRLACQLLGFQAYGINFMIMLFEILLYIFLRMHWSAEPSPLYDSRYHII